MAISAQKHDGTSVETRFGRASLMRQEDQENKSSGRAMRSASSSSLRGIHVKGVLVLMAGQSAPVSSCVSHDVKGVPHKVSPWPKFRCSIELSCQFPRT